MDWLNPRRLHRSDWVWIFGLFALLSLITTLPYGILWGLTPPNEAYAWASVFYYDDYFQYYAWAGRIAGGDWLIRNYYTHNPDASFGLFNPFFLVLGWVTRLSGNVHFSYHLLRVAAIGIFIFVSYAFAGHFLGDTRSRRASQLLMLGGGIEFPWLQLFGTRNATPLADPYIYKVLYRYGHLTAALCLLLLVFGCYVEWLKTIRGGDSPPTRRGAAGILLGSLTLGLINPYYVALMLGVLIPHALLTLRSRRTGALRVMLLLGAGCAPPMLHYKFQPVTSSLGSIAFDDPIGLLDLLLFYGPILPLAAWGWRRLPQPLERMDEDAPWSFLLVWLAAVLLMALLPHPLLPFKARMVFGAGVALALLAARAIGVKGPGGAGPPRALLWPLCALMMVDAGYTIYKEWLDFSVLGTGRIDRGLLAAFDALDGLVQPGDVVIAPIEAGNLLPAYCRANTYAGHSFQTENFYEKERELAAFYSTAPPAPCLAFARGMGAAYVLITPASRVLRERAGLENPAVLAAPFDGWPVIYSRSRYVILRVP